MALWDITSRLLTQLASSSVGLAIKRFSSGATGDLQQWQNESGTALASVNSAGTIVATNGATVTQKDASTVGLVVKRFSSGTTTDLFQTTDESNNVGVNFGYDGQIGFSPRPSDGQVQWQINNNGATQAATFFRLYNPWAGYMFQSQVANFDAASFRPGAINAYNSLGTLKMSGLAAASGAPTASTWVAGDWFIDSKGVPQLCTAGGTPGTWAGGGWQLAGFYKFASALAVSGTVTIPAFDELMIVIDVVSMSSTTDVPALVFNGDNAGTTYSYSFLMGSATQATATITASGAISQPVAKLSGNTGSFQRQIVVNLSNKLASSKVGTVVAANGSGVAATSSVRDVSGQVEWVNTSAQITSVALRSAGGSLTFPIGSGFQVFGRDFA